MHQIHSGLPFALAGIAGIALTLASTASYAFGWNEAVETTDSGSRTVARFNLSENIRYQVDGLCRDGKDSVLEVEIQATRADEDEFAKYFPVKLAATGKPKLERIPVEVTFDWSAASNPWYAYSTHMAGTHRLTLPFDKQSYYTNKVWKLIRQATYLNLKLKDPDSPREFTTSIPLNGLDEHLENATACHESRQIADTGSH